ncbi:MAG: DUF2075 domain-containing protein [Balneolales bacterium]
MIIYKNSSEGFMQDVDTNRIADRIKEAFYAKTGKTRFHHGEDLSWHNSLMYMDRVLQRSGIPGDCGVLIEYKLPSTSKRIDFIVSGRDEAGNKKFIIVELKQWAAAESTSKKDLVLTPYYKQYVTHPSYQASSYKGFLSDFNENVYTKKLIPYACAYLHNYSRSHPEPLADPIYSESIDNAPIYFKDDYEKLGRFLREHVGRGSGMDILYDIESGNIRPSKQLVDHVLGLFKGNREFHLIDEQKVTYELALERGLNAQKKTVILVNGGPGTGKSVVSMSLLGGFLKKRKNVFFVAPNAAFREVMLDKLAGGRDGARAKHLLTGSGRYVDTPENTFDIIVVDEAHRLKNKSAFMYQGDNQVEDIVSAAKVSIFFIDDDQVIRPEDIGAVSEVRRVAKSHKADIIELELATQFRCSGADGYVNWVNDVLDIRDTGNFDGWDKERFEFRIAGTPNEVRDWVNERASQGYRARVLAGYAWKWTSVKEGNADAEVPDVSIPEHDFAMPWNSRKLGSTWAIEEEGLGQVGCVHTAQGLEFDYVGVLIGDDLKYRFLDRNQMESRSLFDDVPDEESYEPATIEYGEVGYAADEGEAYRATGIPYGEYYSKWEDYRDSKGKQGLRDDPESMCRMIRNIYRILLTRGMKGCCVYFTDKALEKYFRDRLEKTM